MKRFLNISILAVALVSLCGCEQNENLGNEDINISIPKDGYIYFDTEVNSRGVLIYDYLRENFSVLGYRYATSWSSEGSLASQNSMINTSTTMGIFGTEGAPGVQLVKWGNSAHSYEPVKPWDNSLTYSFFAWYPSDIPSSGSNYIGQPYITYTLDTQDPANHKDVMTACVIDTKSTATKTVSFNMQHRLSAIDIIARSYVNAEAIDAEEAVKVKINSVSIELGNILYDGATIPLNTEDEANVLQGTSSEGWNKTLNFSSLVTGVTMDYYSDASKVALLTEVAKKTMILIPQAKALTCKVNVNYDIVNEEGNAISYNVENGDGTTTTQYYTGIESSSTVSIKELKEGTYYNLLLNFTKSGITVQVLKAEAWEEKDDVEHDFE